ncbi:MAG TPA: twin-arginine translocase TatA/TatE family subunit [Candidatus Hydrogenedentes bacterium]|nr:twin-arginine translocase TatA/TatE family subunit [Candidatus Hydrogenedentota bacterium]HRK33613.1 twin-arginine translocase TatA/TatE family subunit [Candidatus Hydrogenedentota bacterium]
MWYWIPTGWELMLVVFILLLVFGAKRLPSLARSVGQSITEFKDSVKPKDPEKLDSDNTNSAKDA